MDGELPCRIALIAFTGVNIGIRLCFHKHAKNAGDLSKLNHEGRELLLLKLAMVPWMLAPLLYMLHPPLMAWAAVPLPSWMRWLGAAWSAACSLLLWSVHKALDANFSPALRIRPGHTLVTQGPYRRVRHPMYTMGVMAWLAAGLLTANWFISLGGLVFLAHSLRRIPREEAMMIAAFGEAYRAYQQRTGRLLPRLKRR